MPLWHRELRRKGLFTREWRLDAKGQYWDLGDGKPFSTQFSHTRFLVPHLARQAGLSWALFCDCDFLWRTSTQELLKIAIDQPNAKIKALWCVQHQHVPDDGEKLDGIQHTRYRRKNWSSCVLWNVCNPAHDRLTPAAVNTETGSFLHGFEWVRDEAIGNFPLEWIWLAGVSKANVQPKAVHYTYGTPDMPGYEDQAFAEEWWEIVRAGADDAMARLKSGGIGPYLGDMGKEIPW